ncbi:hypothetical protein D3C76_1138470 [compost metagenome]
MGVQADFLVQRPQQQHATGDHRAVDLLAAQTADLLATALKARLLGLIALLGHASGAAQQFAGVILGQAFTDPVAVLAVVDLREHMHQFAQHRA